jgi:GNAT superfamily N-acetyltransferase
MIFQSKSFYVDLVENKDIKEVLEVYNSNERFLINHMDRNKVTSEWIFQELEGMRDVGFYSCKIVEISTGKIIGIVDFKVDDETYLSLLMMHNAFQGKGLGKLILNDFEEYTKSFKSKCIRIDVVTNYDNSALNFWINNGFIKFKDVELNWTGKILPAVTMKKFL